jgi:hypothetical protein
VAVASYKLERSMGDTQSWDTIASGIQFTEYFDADTKFDTHYNYRVSAVDTSGNVSGYATPDITASSFQPNAGANQSVTLHSEDGVVTVEIPSGALPEDAVCNIKPNTNLGDGPTIKSYVLLSGPYNVICKTASSGTIGTFKRPLAVTINIKGFKKKKDLAYFVRDTQNNGQWSKIGQVSRNKKANTDSFSLTSGTSIAIMGKLHHTPWWVTSMIVLVSLLALGGGVVAGGKFMVRRRLEKQYEDYHHKATGL